MVIHCDELQIGFDVNLLLKHIQTPLHHLQFNFQFICGYDKLKAFGLWSLYEKLISKSTGTDQKISKVYNVLYVIWCVSEANHNRFYIKFMSDASVLCNVLWLNICSTQWYLCAVLWIGNKFVLPFDLRHRFFYDKCINMHHLYPIWFACISNAILVAVAGYECIIAHVCISFIS